VLQDERRLGRAFVLDPCSSDPDISLFPSSPTGSLQLAFSKDRLEVLHSKDGSKKAVFPRKN